MVYKEKSKKEKISLTDCIKDPIEQTKKIIDAFIGSSTEAPFHMIDNDFITGGYRINHDNSVKAILRSLFKFHNEFVNVWSHFIGALFFIGVFIYTCFYMGSMKSMTNYMMISYNQAQL